MDCINCGNPAVWVFKASGVAERGYCNVHLPSAYRGTKNVRPADKPVYFEDDPAKVEGAPVEAAASPTAKKSRAKKAVEDEPVDAGDLEKPVVEE